MCRVIHALVNCLSSQRGIRSVLSRPIDSFEEPAAARSMPDLSGPTSFGSFRTAEVSQRSGRGAESRIPITHARRRRISSTVGRPETRAGRRLPACPASSGGQGRIDPTFRSWRAPDTASTRYRPQSQRIPVVVRAGAQFLAARARCPRGRPKGPHRELQNHQVHHLSQQSPARRPRHQGYFRPVPERFVATDPFRRRARAERRRSLLTECRWGPVHRRRLHLPPAPASGLMSINSRVARCAPIGLWYRPHPFHIDPARSAVSKMHSLLSARWTDRASFATRTESTFPFPCLLARRHT